MKDLGARLADLRQRSGHTQESLSALTGVSRAHISKLEKDPSANPTIHVLSALVEGCGSTLSEFFRDYTPPDYPDDYEELCRKLFVVMESEEKYRTSVEVQIDALYGAVTDKRSSGGGNSQKKALAS